MTSQSIAPSAPDAAARPDRTPIVGGLLLGLAASLCCGGTLLFAAIGLGAAYGSLQLSRYIPEALAIGAALIALMNWLYYRRKAARLKAACGPCNPAGLRRAMRLSAFVGLVKMSATFILLEWLNHGVVHAQHFMSNPAYANAIIPGVPNSHLGYLALTYLALPVLALLPLPEGVDIHRRG